MDNQFFSPSNSSEKRPEPQGAIDDKKNSEDVITRVLGILGKEYVVIGTARVNVFRSWLAIGLVAGVAVGIILVANRSGEVEDSRAAIEKKLLPISYPKFVPGEILVSYHEGFSDVDKDKFRKKMGFKKVKNVLKEIDAEILEVPAGTEEDIVKALSKNHDIVSAETNDYVELAAPPTKGGGGGGKKGGGGGTTEPAPRTPDDQFYSYQWHLSKIGMPQAWGYTTATSTPLVVIAIIDSGITADHPDLSAKIIGAFSVSSYDPSPIDYNSHGTMVAGTAAAVTNSVIGVAAPLWGGKIVSYKATAGIDYYSRVAPSTDIAKGIIAATDFHADIINVSFCCGEYKVVIQNAIAYARSKGSLVVGAAGNCGCDLTSNYGQFDDPYLISVASTNSGDGHSTFSSFGGFVDISAPGEDILSTYVAPTPPYDYYEPFLRSFTYGYAYDSGTSFSAPIVSGVLALMKSVNPSLTPDQLENILYSTALDRGTAGRDTVYGWGRVDAAKAVKQAKLGVALFDALAPKVKIPSPVSGSILSGVAAIAADASDNVGVKKVEFIKYNSATGVTTVAGTDITAPYSYSWDTRAETSMDFTFHAVAYDAKGNSQGSNYASFTANNTPDAAPPTVTIALPPAGSVLPSSSTDINTYATDDVGIAKIELYFDDLIRASCLWSSSCVYTLDTSVVSPGIHTISARAFDPSGKMSSTTISVTK